MSATPVTRLLEELVCELLDAHSDTVALVAAPAEGAWDAHLDYLRALHRRARRILAEATVTANGASSGEHATDVGEQRSWADSRSDHGARVTF